MSLIASIRRNTPPIIGIWVILLIAVTSIVGYAAEPSFTRVTNSTQRLEFEGFSILPPKGEDWFIASSILRKQLGGNVIVSFHKLDSPPSATRTVSATVRGGRTTLTGERGELLQRIARNNFAKTERHRPVSVNISHDSTLAPNCVRFDGTIEDLEVPLFPGSVFILEQHGFVCIHPDLPDVVLEIQYSQRRLQEEAALSLETEGEPFLRSLIFQTFPPPGVTKPTTRAQESSKRSGPELGSERTWKRLPVYSPTIVEKSSDTVLTYGADATVEVLERYYLPRLERNGWKLTKREAFKTTKFGGSALHLVIEGEKRNASIWIIEKPQDKFTLVMLGCFGEDRRSACEDD